MARYSMHLRDGTEKLIDSKPQEYPSVDALRDAVLMKACDVLRHDAGEGILDSRFRIDAEDDSGCIVHSLRLEHALAARAAVANPL